MIKATIKRSLNEMQTYIVSAWFLFCVLPSRDIIYRVVKRLTVSLWSFIKVDFILQNDSRVEWFSQKIRVLRTNIETEMSKYNILVDKIAFSEFHSTNLKPRHLTVLNFLQGLVVCERIKACRISLSWSWHCSGF